LRPRGEGREGGVAIAARGKPEGEVVVAGTDVERGFRRSEALQLADVDRRECRVEADRDGAVALDPQLGNARTGPEVERSGVVTVG
jgi:hypothetical protein